MLHARINLTLPLIRFLENAMPVRKMDIRLLHVGIDSSGAVDQHRFVCYGSVSTDERRMHAFDVAWDALLDKYDLAHIRMTEAMGFTGAFRGKRKLWGRPARSDSRRGAEKGRQTDPRTLLNRRYGA